MVAQIVAEQLLQMAIDKSVSEKLGVLTRDYADFTRGLSEEEKKEASLLIIKMMMRATDSFFTKMEIRISSKSVKSG